MPAASDYSRPSVADLATNWIVFLDRYRFDWFFTGTFREAIHAEEADKRWRRFTNDLNRQLYGRRWMRRPHGGIYWARASERQRRGVLHFHALMGDWQGLDEKARRLTWMDNWNDLAGFAQIERIVDETAVRRYLSKYVVKDGEIELSDNLADYDRFISMFRQH